MTSIFKYTLPSGKEYQVDGPDIATQRQADEVFYAQVAAGSLVGYTAGQTLSSAETKVTKFGLSRLDRGTAGVDDTAIIAIIGGTSISASIPTLNGIPLNNPVSQANVIAASQGLGASGIGPLTAIQVQSLMAQNAAQVNQAYNVISNEKGIGKYGFTSLQLEEAGYLKPGTTARYLNPNQVPGNSNPSNFMTVMNSPTVWTGLDGIFSLDDLLANQEVQDKIQQILMKNAYTKLTNAGVIQTSSVAGVSLGTGLVYTTNGLVAPNTLVTATQAGLAGQITAAVDNSTANTAAVLSAAQVLSNTINASDSGIESVLSGIKQGQAYSQQGQALLSQVQQNVGALTAVASKYGTQAAAVWSKGLPGLQDAAGNLLKGQIAGVQAQALGIVNGVKGQAEAIVNQGKAAIDSAGKMGKYAVDFANGKVDTLTAGVKQAAAYTDTVSRETVNQAVKGILGNPKIPSPDFSSASALGASVNADIEYAKNALASINNQTSQVLAQGQAISGTATGIINTAQGFGAQAQNLGTGIVGQAQNFGTSIPGQVTRGIRLG